MVVADDSVLLREGLVRVLAEAGARGRRRLRRRGRAARGSCPSSTPDLAVLDVRMPPTFRDEGVRAAIRARELLPRRRHPAAVAVCRGRLRAGAALGRAAAASATCSRTASPRSTELADAIERIAAGGTVLDPEVVAQLHRPPARPARHADPARARGAAAHGGGAHERGDRRRARSSASAPWRRT